MKLLFITSSRLGDAVLSTGLLHHAVQRFNPSEIWVACGSIAAPLFQALPGVKRVIALEKQPYGRHWLTLWQQGVGQGFGVVIDLRNSIVSYLLFARHTFRLGRSDKTRHKAEQLAAVMAVQPVPYNKIWLNQAVQAQAAAWLPPGDAVLALCPTANWFPKMWPAERFVAAARQLPFQRIAVFGAAHEREQAASLLESLSQTHAVIDLIGKTDPLQAAACMERVAFCLANDSGLMHIAAAMGTPTLGIFGPSFDREYSPWGKHTAFIRAAPFLGLEQTADPKALMLAVEVKAVVEAARKLMAAAAG